MIDDAGAVRDDEGRILHFGNPVRERRAATGGSVMCDLSHQALIRAEGADAITFLQGQLTCNVAEVDAGHSRLGGYCTPKGRLIALFRLFARDDAIFLRLPAELQQVTLERLRKYLLMSKLTLDPADDALVGIGLAGPHCEEHLRQVIAELPAVVNDVVTSGELSVIRVPGVAPRFEIYGPFEAMTKTWSLLDVNAAPVGMEVWTLLDILAGVPEIRLATSEEFVPQSVNLDLLDAISFSKGCYTGQEIVARLHYRGTVKRRMVLARCDDAVVPAPGDSLHASGAGEQTIGHVVSAAPAPERGYLLLISTAIEHARADTLHLGSPAGPLLEIDDLPYLQAGPH